MMTRVPLALAPLFVAACTDDLVAPHPLAPIAEPAHVTQPGPRPQPVTAPTTCVSVDAGIRRFGTTGHDDLRDVVVSPTGTILAAGYELATDGGDGDVVGARGVVVEYWHDLTSVQRRALLDTSGTDTFESIELAPDTGTVWLAARTDGDVPALQSAGGLDLVVGELGGELALTGGFTARYRGLDGSAEHPRRLAVAPGGQLAVAGSERRVVLGPAWTNPVLAVLSATEAGVAAQWSTRRVSPAIERYDAVALSPDAVVVGGAIVDTADQGMFVAARTLDAEITWQRKLSTAGSDTVTAVHVLPDGDVLWAGSAVGPLGPEAHGGLDAVVGRLDGSTGEPEWLVQYGDRGDERVTDMAVDATGRIHLVGSVAAQTPDGPRGDDDAFLIVLDADGSMRMQEQWGSDGDDRANAVTVDPCGAIVVAGHSDGDLAPGTPRGGRDGFVAVTRLQPW